MRAERRIRVDIGGIKYQIVSDDNYLDFIKDGFDPELVMLLKTLASDCETIFDVGANIGCTAILFAGLSKRVHAFEPSKTTFRFLSENLKSSGLRNVTPHNVGLGLEPGEYPLTFHPSNRSGAFVSNHTRASSGHETESVVIKPMDEVVAVLKPSSVDFIKIDVEGFEGSVLRGGIQTISKYKPMVVLELNHWCLNAFQRTSLPDFFDFLRSIFPVLYAVDQSNYMDLHDESDRYIVMYHHIIHRKFPNIVAAYEVSRLNNFLSSYRHNFS
jgi:FkbM family methyltransferase